MNNHANKYGMPSLWILHQTVDCQWGSWTCVNKDVNKVGMTFT